jgi:hypothetical protein
MLFYRCQCGESQSWSSMGHSKCDPCEKCGTAIALGPDGHGVEPHQWSEPYWIIDSKTGERAQEQRCRSCQSTRKFEAVTPDIKPL